MAIENSITFGGINSADFGIYISGEGVFNAPKRDAEMIEIPGRNGAFVLDNGRFENITVTYPAFNFESDYDTFVQNLSDFRNAICAQVGYQRLTDTFHPDEYRMAAYVEGLEIKPIKYNTASQFDIVFDCKPQRWLTSGEEAVTVESGDTLTNPTRFEAGPMLEVEGYGSVQFNGYEIELGDGTLGEIEIAPAGTGSGSYGTRGFAQFELGTVPQSSFAQGDTFTIEASSFKVNDCTTASNATLSVVSNSLSGASTQVVKKTDVISHFDFTFNFPAITFDVFPSTAFSEAKNYVTLNAGNGTTITITAVVTYYKTNGSIIVTMSVDTDYFYFISTPTESTRTSGRIWGDSSVSLLGEPTYIDCDLGEAYKIEDGSIISLNQYIDLGSDLPVLASGENEVTFDNTVTDLKMKPRWWKV
jgi:phage-related protein